MGNDQEPDQEQEVQFHLRILIRILCKDPEFEQCYAEEEDHAA